MSLLTIFPRVARLPLIWPIVVLIGSIGIGPVAQAQDEINTGYFGNVAIKGYDPVSYFTPGKAEQGSEEHAMEWLGASWHFVNDENKEAFEADPLSYAPQYGGYCSVGVADGSLTRDIDPEAWTIIDGKLYLNYSTEVRDILTEEIINVADTNWEAIHGEGEE
jgi:YHS domain-containing protein